jgi:hypothetical protein
MLGQAALLLLRHLLCDQWEKLGEKAPNASLLKRVLAGS